MPPFRVIICVTILCIHRLTLTVSFPLLLCIALTFFLSLSSSVSHFLSAYHISVFSMSLYIFHTLSLYLSLFVYNFPLLLRIMDVFVLVFLQNPKDHYLMFRRAEFTFLVGDFKKGKIP